MAGDLRKVEGGPAKNNTYMWCGDAEVQWCGGWWCGCGAAVRRFNHKLCGGLCGGLFVDLSVEIFLRAHIFGPQAGRERNTAGSEAGSATLPQQAGERP